MLANTENIEISSGEEGPTHPMEGALDRLTMAMDQFTLSLLSTTRHHEQLSDFQVGVFTFFSDIFDLEWYRQRVSRALQRADISPRGRECQIPHPGQIHRVTSREAPSESLRHLKEKGGGSRANFSGIIIHKVF